MTTTVTALLPLDVALAAHARKDEARVAALLAEIDTATAEVVDGQWSMRLDVALTALGEEVATSAKGSVCGGCNGPYPTFTQEAWYDVMACMQCDYRFLIKLGD